MRALGWIGGVVGLLALIAAGFAFAFMEPKGFDWVAVVAIVGLVGVGSWFAIYWGTLKELGDDQGFGRTVVSTVAIGLALGIAVVANVAVHRYDERWDLTKDKQYSLSPEAVEVAGKLDQEVEIFAFFIPGLPDTSNFEKLMEAYREHTTLLKVSFHDPYGDPLLTGQMKLVSERGTVILRANGREQRLEDNFGEEALTNALIRLTSSKPHPVCAITGHGERDINDEYGAEGLGFAKIKLEGKNHQVTALNLLEKAPTLEECAVLLLAGPQTDLAPGELDRVARDVAAGGGLEALLDPLVAMETAADFARFGLKLGNDVIVEGDPNRQTSGGPTVLVLDPSSYESSVLTEKLKGIAVFVLARSVEKGADVAGLTVQVLGRASDLSWAETKLDDPAIAPQPDPGVDIVGKVPVFASVEVVDPAAIRATTETAPPPAVPGLATPAPPPETGPAPKAGGKVVVFGDSDFASNQAITKYTNQDLFLNSVAWMVGETDQLSIRANDATKGKLELDLLGLVVALLIAAIGVPGLAVLGGVGTWLYRRKL
jgi:hypothetical protein